jgi:predicted dehydrogenase
VVVSLPTSLHQEVVGAALEAGCHVFCEKPLGMSSNGARALMELAERSARVLMVGYHNRFLDAYREARRVIRSGALGDLVGIRATHLVGGPYLSWEPKSPWYFSRDNGGVLYDAGSHIFDLVHYLTGTGIEQVCATTAKLNAESEVPDQIAIAWRARAGAVGTALLGWGSKSGKQEVFVYGTQGHVTATPMTTEVRTPQHNKISDMFSHLDAARDIVTGIAKGKLKKEPVPPAYQRQICGFLDAIGGQRSEHLSIQDSIAALEDLERVHATLTPEGKQV